MTRRPAIIAGAAVVLLMTTGGSIDRSARRLAAELGDRVAGKPVDCVDTNRAQSPQIIDSRTILYRDGTRLWRNDLPAACPGLRADGIIVTRLYGAQLCRNDSFQIVERLGSIPGPICRLGRFTPYSRVKKPR